MKRVSIIIISLFFSFFSLAQQSGKVVGIIKGKVINSTTNEPVSYTNIGLEGTYFGTASDGDGNFELKIPEEMAEKNIYFSAVGFTNKQFAVKTLFDKDFSIIKLDAQSYGIDNIDIAAQNLVLVRILKMTWENIPYNYITGPYNLEVEYSNNKIIDDSIQSEEKANVLIYDHTGYSKPSTLDAFQNLNYSVKIENPDNNSRFSTKATNIDDLLEIDWVRTAASVLNPGILNGFKLSLDSEPTIDGKECWIISFGQKKPTLAGSGDFYASTFNGEITIVKEDYSVLKIEGKVESPKNNRQGKSLAIGKTNTSFYQNVKYSFSTKYTEQRIDKITLNKTYTFESKNISESSVLKISKARANNLTQLENRDYFIGE